jgi:hypothetical protein
VGGVPTADGAVVVVLSNRWVDDKSGMALPLVLAAHRLTIARRSATSSGASCAVQLCVLRIDNEPRVRDGYISESTSGHPRALLAER